MELSQLSHAWRALWYALHPQALVGWRRVTPTAHGAPLPQLQAKANLLRDIVLERGNQINKWGDRSHPSAPWYRDGIDENSASVERQIAGSMHRAAKMDCARAYHAGMLTWWHIAWEELSEALDADSERERRAELVQLAAVCVAWIEDIDKKADAQTRAGFGAWPGETASEDA